MSKIDKAAASITVDDSSLLRIDNVALFRLVIWDGELWVQVKDRNKARSSQRGHDCIMVPLDLFVAKLVKTAQRFGG